MSVTCTDKNNEIRMLKSNDDWYSEMFKCNDIFGWTDTKKYENVDSEKEVLLECVPKSCNETLISSTNESIAKYQFDGNSLTCGIQEITLVFNHSFYDKIYCKKEHHWRSDKGVILANANETIVADCIPKACDPRLISKDPNVMLEGEPLTLNCSKKGLDLHIANTATYHKQLTCDPTKGWLDGTKLIKKSWERIDVECVPGNCNFDLIEFAQEKVKILPSNADSRYTHAACVNENERIFANGNFRKSLECDESSGWKDGTTQIGKLPRDKIVIECKVPNCDAVFIKNFKSKILYNLTDLERLRQQLYPMTNSISELGSDEKQALDMEQQNRMELSCPSKTHFVRFNGVFKLENVECSIKDNEWLGIGAAGDSDVHVECIQVCQWSIPKSLKSKMEKSDIRPNLMPHETLKYYCIPKDVPRILIYNGKRHTSLHCSLHDGWTDEGGDKIKNEKGEIIAVDTEIDLQCEDYCTKFTEKPDDFVVNVDRDRLEVRCKNQSFAIRTINAPGNQIVPEMSCTYRGGWQGPPGTPQIYPDTLRQLQFECYKVCTNTPSTILKERHDSNGTKSIKCLDDKTLYINDKPSRPLTCNAHDGWRDAEDPSIHYSSLETLKSSCRAAKLCKRNSVNLVKEIQQQSPIQEGPGMFACKNKKIGSTNNGSKLNGAFVHSQLKCDIFRGWLDVEGKQLAKPEDKVDLECDTVKCTTSPHYHKCADYSKKYPDIFNNYVCMSQDFDNDNDPNLRVCGAKQKLLTEKGVLVDKGLRCTDDGSWHTIEDEKKVRTADNGTAAFCVQKRCTMCSKPTEFKDANYYTEDPTYDEGNAETCAKATCPSDLWIASIGGQTHEYVAKSMVCSSTNESKWDLKDGKFADNIACASRFETCDAFKLNTECDNTFANCSEISLDHRKNNYCPGDTLMFYKNRSELTFKDENNEKRNSLKLALRCDGSRGWTVNMGKWEVVDTIDQGGQVICAPENPLPAIRATTTKAPILIACKACPTPIQSRLDCPDCSSTGPDIALETSSEADKCYAKSVTGGGIISEKLGHIEGKIECQLSNPVWKHEGTEVGKFAASMKSKEADNSQAQKQSSTANILILFVTISSMIGIFN